MTRPLAGKDTQRRLRQNEREREEEGGDGFMNERWQQAFWTNSHTSPPLLQISAPAPSPCSHFHPSPTPHPPSRWAQPWESVLPDPAIAAPAEEIIGASRRVITGGGCEIAATKLCLWPRDQPQPSHLSFLACSSSLRFHFFLWSSLRSGAQTRNPQIQQLRINDCSANNTNVGRNIYKKESVYFLSFLQQKKIL